MRLHRTRLLNLAAAACCLTVALALPGCEAETPSSTADRANPSTDQASGGREPPGSETNSESVSNEHSTGAKTPPARPSAAPTATSTNETTPKPLAPPTSTSWPSFRNGNAQLGVAGSDLPVQPELLWKVPDADGIVAAAAIVGDHVYVGALSGNFRCLDRRTGELVWNYKSLDDPDPSTFLPGFKSAPTVTADSVYVGDEDGTLHAIDRATGKQRWIFKTGAEIPGAAAVVGDHVIFGSHDSFLYSVKAEDGSENWKFQTNDRVNCAPAIVGNYTFVAGCDEHLRVINIDTGEQKSDIPLESYLIASPAVLDNMLYVGTYASEVVAVNWKDEKIVWRYKNEDREFPYHASAAVTDKYVVVGGHDKQMHCIDRATGEGVWTFPTKARIESSAAIVGDRVYFGSSDRNLYGLTLADGKEIWKFNAGKDVQAGIAVGEGCLVVGTEGQGSFIYCFGKKEE